MRKKIAAVLIAAALVFSTVPASNAYAVGITNSSNEEMQKTITSVLTKVKERISVDEELNEFSYDYDQIIANSVRYTFCWNNPDYTKSLRVVCDEAGNIQSYYYRDNESQTTKDIQYLRSELYETALEYIDQLNPGLSGHVRLTDAYYSYDNCYTYSFMRIENDLTLKDNSISVTVSATDKSLKSMYANWNFELSIPDNAPKITKEKAAFIIGENLKMNLAYRSYQSTEEESKTVTKAFLVYEPDQSYIAVDALTGEVYTAKSEWNYTKDSAAADCELGTNAKAEETDTGNGGLTEEEIDKIDELKNLISKEKAIQLIQSNKYLLLEDTAKSITANLYQRYNNKEEGESSYFWRIEFRDPREPDYENGDTYRSYATASIDAKTGEIIYYYSSVKSMNTDRTTDNTDLTLNYSDSQIRSVFKNFAKEQNAEHFALTKLTSEVNDYVYTVNDSKEVCGGKSYTYTRHNENIPFDSNQIYGCVDKVSGKVYSYGSRWTDNVTFESPKGAMTSEQALTAFLDNDEFNLSYELNKTYNYDMSDSGSEYGQSAFDIVYDARLVYSIENIYPMMISPFTGKQISYDGSEYQKKELNLLSSFTDIKNSPYKRSIQILNDMGLNLTEEKFYPYRYITGADMVAFAQAAGMYCDEETVEFMSTGKVTRQKAAKFFTQLLGLEGVAKLNTIFTTGSKDQDSIKADNLGSVALMKGFGILEVDADGNLCPNQRVTRGEAADMLLKLYAIQSQNQFYYR